MFRNDANAVADRMKGARLFFDWAVLLGLAITGAFYLQTSNATQRLDNQLLDTFSTFSRPAISDDITIVAIDDRSLDALGEWPWPRSNHAQLIDRLNDAGARVIVLDLLFLEESDGEEDAALARAMERSGNVLLPHTFVARPNASTGLDPLYPIDDLNGAAATIGHVVAVPDSDGILRRFDLVFTNDQEAFPHIALLAIDYGGEARQDAVADQTAIIPFHPGQSFVRHSASEVLIGAIPDAFFRDKIVLVGATAQGTGDRYSVASGEVGLMTGVETQANLINALSNDVLIRPAASIWQTAAMIAALIVLFLAFWFLSPRLSFYVVAVLIGGFILTSAGLLASAQVWFPVATTIIMIAISYPLWSWRRLSYVSKFLDREATRLIGSSQPLQSYKGMEYVARQIDQVRKLISSIEGSLSFIREVIETAPDAIIVLDERQQVQMLNTNAAKIFPDWGADDHPALAELLLTARANLQSDGRELTTPDGSTYLVARAPLNALTFGAESYVTYAPSSAGKSGEILALRDITEFRRLDKERNQMLEFLSHDMRNPQVAIIGLTQTQVNADSAMVRIRDQANRTLKLADDFVQLARLETLDLQREDTDLGALIEEACDRAFVQAEAKQIGIGQDIPDDPCFADVDASLIARMLDNLIGNAVKYSDVGANVDVSLKQAGNDAITIGVSDTGPGLPPARLEKPFARFGAFQNNDMPSAGLGLALVKKVVDAHHGTISVDSGQATGTRFLITLLPTG